LRRVTKEEYIETIFLLEKKDGKAQTGLIADKMDVKPPSVTEMLRKLQDEELVNYEPYLGATLTDKGKAMAKELMVRHKVIAEFLEIIGVDENLAEQDACTIEHHVSRASAEQLRKFVEFIQTAPRDPQWIENFKHFCETGERKCKDK